MLWRLALVFVFSLQSGLTLAQQLSPHERGRIIAQQRCARCHAVGHDDERPHDIVTPFRELRSRFPIEMLTEAQKTGIIAGHDEMPMLELSRPDMNALLTYIDAFAPVQKRYIRRCWMLLARRHDAAVNVVQHAWSLAAY